MGFYKNGNRIARNLFKFHKQDHIYVTTFQTYSDKSIFNVE